jgi:hypothetical protein
MDMKHKTLFSDKVRQIYLQLPLFKKEPDECENVFDRFIYVLKHMDILERMPWAAQNSVFQKLRICWSVKKITFYFSIS